MADLAAGLADRGSRLGAALWRWRPLPALAEALAAEGDRRILWLPVFFGTGIALYFTPTFEPPRWLGLAVTASVPAAGAVIRIVRQIHSSAKPHTGSPGTTAI